MPIKSRTSTTFNRHGLHLRWPRIWIIILALILVFLCLAILGMEIGHTIVDVRRSTAFGGFILFIPLMICALFVLITAFKPRLILLRIAVIICCIMILLCMLLIAYDIIVLIDPTQCFFFDCNGALVVISNSTYSGIVSGWPLYITWPAYFQTIMNAKRIFQSIQLLCAGLFILFTSLYLLTCFIYRHIKLSQHTDRRTYTAHETNRSTYTAHETNRPTPTKYSNNASQSFSSYSPHQKVTTYTVEGQPYIPAEYYYTSPPPVTTVVTPRQTKSKTFIRPRSNSVNYDELCTRCNQKRRMILTTNYERQNYFSHLCFNCNNELAHDRRKAPFGQPKTRRTWRP